ncbi:flavin monoamine oxidase family protein [Ovoidimarina sediminis]|uniref:flavin monoamine oxidase family protein n=1 Tax=Ovoidimarina sediminis TaxID=3079856 RepID=UPI00290DFC76|nr:NAD(P)/FAD-dependent oxidoreductase [Rhodophyticola sp. MJ-SS7]MDU8943575.1 NAD(P)/FAD-dependent oxidoreductase [Rhodophyticola sp. MJ-SS7]
MDVVIIGAGLAGLTAATVLRDAGADVLLLEAHARIGGRIQAIRAPDTNQYLADLGPTWVWPKYQPVVARWIRSLGLATFEQFNEGDAVILGYGPAPLRQPLPGQNGMVRIVGGPTAFIDALSNRMDAAGIRASAPVIGIHEDGPAQVSVYLASGEIVSAGRVIVSTPLRVAAAGIDMPWAPPPLSEAMRRTPTWMSTHAKVVALYDRPFWRDKGLAGRIASRSGPLVEAHDHSGASGHPAALFGFVGWPPDMRRKDPQGLKQAILRQLTECFGPPAAHPIDLIVQDWATHSNIVTESDLSQPANHPDIGPALLRQAHLDGRVRFAVSEVSETSPGLIEGALAAGEKAALDSLGNRTS